jgi:hypothetical protein
VDDVYLSLDQLLKEGWEINPTTGVLKGSYTSLSFCLVREGVRLVCVSGFGPTPADALMDAVNQANLWINRESSATAQTEIDPDN